MDAVLFTGMIRELSEKLTGARINKIHQPGADEILFRLWTGTDEKFLYFSTSGKGVFHLTHRRFANPFTPPRFCQLLRARLSRFVSIEQITGERLARFGFTGPQGSCTLIVDFRLKPNLVLLDAQERIIDALRRDPKTGVLPGADYDQPESRFAWLNDSSLAHPAAIDDAQSLTRWLLDSVAPMTPWLARCITQEYSCGTSVPLLLSNVRCKLYDEPLRPTLLRADGQTYLSPVQFNCIDDNDVLERYTTLSEVIEAGVQNSRDRHDDLLHQVNRAIKKLQRRQKSIARDAEKMKDIDQFRKQAELLAAQRHLLEKGLASVDVDDYYCDPPVKVNIKLNPRLTPQENIDRKFKEVRKFERGTVHVSRRLAETESELTWLHEMELALNESDDGVERDALARELCDAGYLTLRQEPASRKRAETSEPLWRTHSPAGYELVWGKNPRGNDQVSTRLAHSDDLWFHVHNQPGCHLLLRRAGFTGDIPLADIEYAASLAAGYSSARYDTRAEVMMARAGAVRKPKGARPGAVVVDTFEAIRVAPQRLPEKGGSD